MFPRLTNFFLLLIVAVSCPSFTSLAAAQRDSGAQALQVQQAAPANPAVYPFDGIVVNAVTGEPIRNALVSISQGGARSSLLTGPDGKFHFDVLGADELGINVQKPGFFSEAELTHTSTTVRVGLDAPQVVLKLVQEGVIFGQITDADGRPAEELPVKMFYATIVDGRKDWREQIGLQTNDNGEYRIFELQPGSYYLSAGGFASTYYPGVRDMDSAAMIRVTPGQQVRADFQLQPAALYQISGTVSGLPPGITAYVEMIGADVGALWTNFPSHRDGSFTRTVSAGRYLLRARSATINGELAASVFLDVNADITGVRLALSPTATIPVDFIIEPTRGPRPDSSDGGVPPVNVALTPTYRATRLGFQVTTHGARIDLQPGTYRAEVTPTGSWYVEAARRGSTDLLSQELVVDSGGEGEPIEITLRDDMASLRGSVTSEGRPGPGSVLLIPERTAEQAITIPVDAAGHFQLDSVPPGEYTAFAFDRTAGLEYRNPEAMRPYANGAQVVRLSPGGEANVNLPLQRRQEY